jgi:V8-like Glu-specific endopeptidase
MTPRTHLFFNTNLVTRTLAPLSAAALLLLGGCNEAVTLLGAEDVDESSASIVNGTSDSGHASVAYLEINKSGSWYICTGTLIGKHTVLTAAHCVASDNKPYTVVGQVQATLGGNTYAVSKTTIHASYDGGNKSDFAILKLSQDVSGIAPSYLATTAPYVGEKVTMVGFGITQEGGTDSGVKRMATNTIGDVWADLIGVYGSSGSSGNICRGDSGGPTFATRNGKEVLVGVHSTAQDPCGIDGYSMRVDAFYSWVYSNAAGDLFQGDTSAPKVSITSPASNAQVATTFSVQVTASDDIGVAKVVLFLSAKKISERTSSPYTFQVQNATAGAYTLEAVAYDAAGNSTSAHTSIKVGSSSSSSGKAFGATCSAASECQSKLCTSGSSSTSGGQGFCSKSCSKTSDCGGSYECRQNVCQTKTSTGGSGTTGSGTTSSTEGSFGASCSALSDCASGLCAIDNATGDRFCTRYCDLELSNCPAGSACLATGQTAVCGPLQNAAGEAGLEDGGSVAGGCSVGGPGSAPAGSPLALLLVVLGLVLGGALARRRG